jgi:hypothetical protein
MENGMNTIDKEWEKVLREVVENDGGTRYEHEDDEVGTRCCCMVVSYKDHLSTCFITKAKALLEGVTNET